MKDIIGIILAFVIALTMLLLTMPTFAADTAALVLPDAPAATTPRNNPFSLNTNTADADYVFDMYLQEGGVCTILDKKALTSAINALPKLNEVKTLSQEKPSARIIKVESFNKYAKHIYELRPGELRFDDKGYALTKKQYESLIAAKDRSFDKNAVVISYPYLLTWMNPERVTKISYIDKTGQTDKNYAALKDNLYFVAPSLSSENVTRTSERYDVKATDITKLRGGVYTTVEFDSGAVYRIFIDAKNLYVEYSGEDSGYKYTNASDSALTAYKSSMLVASTKQNSPPPITAPLGKPDNFTKLPSNASRTVPIDIKNIKKIDAYEIFPQYTYSTSNKRIIEDILNFLNGIAILDVMKPIEPKPTINVKFFMEDGTETLVELFDDKISVNDTLYPADSAKKFPELKSKIDELYIQSFRDAGLLSLEGTFTSSKKLDKFIYLIEVKTATGKKDVRVIERGENHSNIVLLTQNGSYPSVIAHYGKPEQKVLIFYEKASNPIIPKAAFIS